MAFSIDTDKINTDQIAPGPTFSAGQVISLKSGGCSMTVLEQRKSDGAVAVVWMTPTGELRRETISPVLIFQSFGKGS